jgi:hypothetical protein
VIDAIKFFIVAIPILLAGWLIYYLLIGGRPASAARGRSLLVRRRQIPTASLAALLFATLRFAAGRGVALVSVHVMDCDRRRRSSRGLSQAPRRCSRESSSALATAFGGISALIYALGMIVFVVLPYTILFVFAQRQQGGFCSFHSASGSHLRIHFRLAGS